MLDNYLLVEKELSEFAIAYSHTLFRAQLILEEMLDDYEPSCVTPRHGPGAVAGGERLNGKWNFSTLYESLHKEWPYFDYMYGVRSLVYDKASGYARSLPLQLAARAQAYHNMVRQPSPVSRLLFVPKDSRGPRIICCEPKELMYIQQGVARHLMNYIERHDYTRDHVNFERQDINGSLALESSRTKEWATIDLSDASDRVSCQLITYLYPRRISKKWLALRSTAVRLPNGEILQIQKFAPMGSAMCFPVESLTFWALAVGYIWECTGDRHHALSSVYVYGDDIIVRDKYAKGVMDALESVCLKVNRQKSFMGKHPFRESCGTDALLGHVVTPLRIRTLPPQRPSDGPALAAYIEYANLAYDLSPQRREVLIKIVERLIGRIPRTPTREAFLSLLDPVQPWLINDYPRVTWNPGLQSFQSRLYVLNARKQTSEIDCFSRLLHNLTVGAFDGDPSQVVDRSSTQIRRKMCLITHLQRGDLTEG